MSSRYVWNEYEIKYDGKLLADKSTWQKSQIIYDDTKEYCLCNAITLNEHNGNLIPSDIVKTGRIGDVKTPFGLFSTTRARYFLVIKRPSSRGDEYDHGYCIENFSLCYWGRYDFVTTISVAAYAQASGNDASSDLVTLGYMWWKTRVKGDSRGRTSGPSQAPFLQVFFLYFSPLQHPLW